MFIQQYLPIAILLILSTILVIITISGSRLLGPFNPNKKKLSPYESGMAPFGSAVRRLPVKYYLIGVLFILFDIEVIFLLPYAVIVRKLGVYGLIVVAEFVILLLIGLFYAWKKGALEWE